MAVAFEAFLEQHQQLVEPIERETAESWWLANMEASEANLERAGAAQKALTRVYADREKYTYLKTIQPTELTGDTARQYQLLFNAFTGNQMDDAVIEDLVDTEKRVEGQYNNHRPLLRGEPTGDNALRDILRSSNDSELRREAWEASKEIGQVVEADVLHMVDLRNREAKRLGFANYYAMALTLQEQDLDTLFRLLDDLYEQTEPVWKHYKAQLDASLATRFGISPEALRPWHYPVPFFQEAPSGSVDLDQFYANQNLEALTIALYDGVGLDIRDIIARSDLYEREGKSQHAFCIQVGRTGDVRVLCNCTGSERWMGTMLHEFGHAVYDKYLRQELPYFLREPAHTLTTEAIAMFFGRLSRSAAFLHRYVGVSAETAVSVAESAEAESAAQLLVFARWVMVVSRFERAMYEDPTQDLNRLWWELVEKYQGITPPEGRNAPDWAAKLHLALAPVYYQNYLLGEMMASQLLEYIYREVLPIGSTENVVISSPKVGSYLKEKVFAQGARLSWNDLITEATGEPLNPAYFVQHLSRGE
jgi:peptidyl-dipeptidase A